MEELKKQNLWKTFIGRGLMIGLTCRGDRYAEKKIFSTIKKIFYGHANQNVIRVLPSLTLQNQMLTNFWKAIKLEIEHLKIKPNIHSLRLKNVLIKKQELVSAEDVTDINGLVNIALEYKQILWKIRYWATAKESAACFESQHANPIEYSSGCT